MIKKILIYFNHKLWRTLFLVGAGVLFAVTLSSLINIESVNLLKQKVALPLQIIYAELIGFISPGPRYILYPILIKLQEFGINIGVIIALISGHVLIEPSTVFVEAGFFGYRFPIKRFVVSLIVTFLAGMLSSVLGNYIW
ncbi:MAG: hypothetical protein DRI23_05200 [Candidatus Cloacimonadota bacterium]|nr:MAG: hypothetical protein DRH79_07235 [Candidatus Cloacimonadota bacterium]RLC51351.1 MAG: hypothetical protein DRI23_05200 [Candidatus Cloacimonadota bacterium]